jgi:hypothetical protein
MDLQQLFAVYANNNSNNNNNANSNQLYAQQYPVAQNPQQTFAHQTHVPVTTSYQHQQYQQHQQHQQYQLQQQQQQQQPQQQQFHHPQQVAGTPQHFTHQFASSQHHQFSQQHQSPFVTQPMIPTVVWPPVLPAIAQAKKVCVYVW